MEVEENERQARELSMAAVCQSQFVEQTTVYWCALYWTQGFMCTIQEVR